MLQPLPTIWLANSHLPPNSFCVPSAPAPISGLWHFLLQLGMHLLLAQSLNSFRFLRKYHLRKACDLKYSSPHWPLSSYLPWFLGIHDTKYWEYTSSSKICLPSMFSSRKWDLWGQGVVTYTAGLPTLGLMPGTQYVCWLDKWIVLFLADCLEGIVSAVLKTVQSGARQSLFEIKFQPVCLSSLFFWVIA